MINVLAHGCLDQTVRVSKLGVCVTTDQLRRPVAGGVATYVKGIIGALEQRTDVRCTQWSGAPVPISIVNWAGSLAGVSLRPTDVLHASSWVIPRWSRRTTTSAFVHDLLWLSNPEWFTPRGVAWHRRRLDELLTRADLLFVPSNAVADKLAEHVSDRDRIVVTGEGSDHVVPDTAEELAELSRLEQLEVAAVGQRYLLVLGTQEPRKNLQRTAEAFSNANLGDDVKLVIVGARGWGVDLRPNQRRNVLSLGYVSDALLSRLLSGAAGLCYASLGEGYGLPVVEAMRRRLAVVTSLDVPVVAESASPSSVAVLVDPWSVDSITAGITSLMSDDSARLAMIDEAARFVADVTWEACAQRHVDGWSRSVQS
jgi:glycosyltransferase involved in cell wall biosynthesis